MVGSDELDFGIMLSHEACNMLSECSKNSTLLSKKNNSRFAGIVIHECDIVLFLAK
jgi:hypothetical protein